MISSRAPGLRLLLAVMSVLLLTALPAAAQRVTVRDARGDVVKVEEGGNHPQAAPGAGVADIVRTTFRHTDRRVVVRTSMAALERVGQRLRVWVNIQDRARRTWYVGVEATPRDRDGHTIFVTGRRAATCAVGHRIDYAADFVRVSIPRSCLATPREVRVGVDTELIRRDWRYAWIDDGLARGDWGAWHWTRWLRSG